MLPNEVPIDLPSRVIWLEMATDDNFHLERGTELRVLSKCKF